jgi:hypothetical protein
MKGTNSLELNHDTVMEAIQEYLDKRLVEKPVVTRIYSSNLSGGIDNGQGTMTVALQTNKDFLEGGKS